MWIWESLLDLRSKELAKCINQWVYNEIHIRKQIKAIVLLVEKSHDLNMQTFQNSCNINQIYYQVSQYTFYFCCKNEDGKDKKFKIYRRKLHDMQY